MRVLRMGVILLLENSNITTFYTNYLSIATKGQIILAHQEGCDGPAWRKKNADPGRDRRK